MSLTGKTALITGAGGGIGRAISVALAKEKVNVILFGGNNVDKLKQTKQLVKEQGVNVWVYAGNLKDQDFLQSGLKKAIKEVGGFDILINTTGVGMHDTEGQSPVTMYAFKGAEVAIDLIYTPQESEFLRLAKLQGLRTLNGAAMLFYQAYYADCLYLDILPSKTQAEELYQKFLLKKA